MWVFGFGSLMWDGWHEQYGCRATVKAELIGYRRRFNKASVKNWGTNETPGPTLNVEKCAECNCKGVAFEFSSDSCSTILDYLRGREGKAFNLTDCEVILKGGKKVTAVVPIYSGKNILYRPLDELAEMVLLASGTSGNCVDYVRSIAKSLKRNGISDPEVEKFAAMVDGKVNAQQGHPADARASRS
ncbi:MAG: gamma-glutamylcyclotransferase [Wenzhouxiangellaceae bacterium]